MNGSKKTVVKNGNNIIMKIQVLVSAVEQDAAELVAKMNIHTDAVLVNQCSGYGYEEVPADGGKVQCFSMPERGVGLSRNTALLHAQGDICLFSDEDIVLADGYAEKILQAYETLPDADMILVNVKVAPARKTYWNTDIHRISFRIHGDQSQIGSVYRLSYAFHVFYISIHPYFHRSSSHICHSSNQHNQIFLICPPYKFQIIYGSGDYIFLRMPEGNKAGQFIDPFHQLPAKQPPCAI